MTVLLVIRLRGNIGVAPVVLDTLARLNLPKKHNAILLTDTPSNKGMLHKVVDYITWGEVSESSVESLVMKRGRMAGDERITEEILKREGLGTPKELAKHIMKDGALPSSIKKTFRLTPPSGGFKRSIKRHYRSHGELGYRGEAINELLTKML